MVLFRKQTPAEQLKLSELILTSIPGVAEIATILAQHGYPAARLTEGRTLLAAAKTAVLDSAAAQGALTAASDHVQESEKDVREAYQDLAKICRTIFLRDRASKDLLGLNKPEPRTQGAFKTAAEKLFNTGKYTDAMRAKLAEHGYDNAMLSQERAKISEWTFAQVNFKQCSGAAEGATGTQRGAMRELVDWVATFIRIARVVLKKRPDLLERLGLKVRNKRTKAQRAAAAKAAATRRKNKAQKAGPDDSSHLTEAA